MGDALSIFDLIYNASWLVQLVMLILVVMSIYSWTIIFSKKKQLFSTNQEIESFENEFYLSNDIDRFYQKLPKLVHNQSPSEQIFYTGYRELQQQNKMAQNDQENAERAYRAMNTVVNKQIDKLSKELSILAMIASSSPYIGLFGTVWGIMQSFIGLSSVKQATITVVAPGIAEALIATAFGLFAAIPATIYHNRLSTTVDLISQRFINFTEELFVIFQR